MAIDEFPIYETLVENIFGSVGLSLIGIFFCIILIFFLTRTSKVFIIYFSMFYFVVVGTLYLGALALVFGFIVVTVYSTTALLRTFFREA